MCVRQCSPRSATIRSLGLIVLQFFVIVILPNNVVGTSALPAVGAASVRCGADAWSIAPFKGEPAAIFVLIGLESPGYVGEHSLVFSRIAAFSAADTLQISRRLRI